MRPYFLANGPDFTCGYTEKIFHTTDIYSLMCHLLGLKAHDNDGVLDNIDHILDVKSNSTNACFSTWFELIPQSRTWITTTNAVIGKITFRLIDVIFSYCRSFLVQNIKFIYTLFCYVYMVSKNIYLTMSAMSFIFLYSLLIVTLRT